MLTQPITEEMIKYYKTIFETYKDKLKPNRKSGNEVLNYLKNKYILEQVFENELIEMVTESILNNEHFRKKLPSGINPEPVIFILKNEGNGELLYKNQDECFSGDKIFVGIDIISGCVHVEGSSLLWDEIFAFQGLDEDDLKNFYLVAEYVKCSKEYNSEK